MNALESGQLWVMRIHAAILAFILGVGAFAAETALVAETGMPWGIVTGPVLLLILYLVLVSPGRHYRAWRYAMDAEDLKVRRGVWIETLTLVPLDRVQHIDLSQGPIERAFHVCRLIVHTAGTQYSRIVVPGLSRADAERMRDEIRARIAPDPE